MSSPCSSRPSLRTLAPWLLALFAIAPIAAQAGEEGAYRILPTPGYLARHGLTQPDAAQAGQMLYYGGSVLANAKVVSVMWGSGVTASTVAGIPGFTAALVNSTYVDPLSQYDTFLNAVDGRPGTQQHIGRGSFLGQIQITPFNTSKKLTNADVVKEMKKQIKAGVLPARDLDTLYMIYFPANVSITLDGMTSCVDYGAYHYASKDTKLAKSNLFYSVEPECGGGFNFITYAASHEFVEAVSDNVPTPGSSPAFPQAWNNATGYEIADLCSASGTLTAADGSHYTVSQYYLNTTGTCSSGNYTSP
jgi:hypothetical protein